MWRALELLLKYRHLTRNPKVTRCKRLPFLYSNLRVYAKRSDRASCATFAVNCGANIPVVIGSEAIVQDSFDLRPATPGSRR
jgi:hypothetical protein